MKLKDFNPFTILVRIVKNQRRKEEQTYLGNRNIVYGSKEKGSDFYFGKEVAYKPREKTLSEMLSD